MSTSESWHLVELGHSFKFSLNSLSLLMQPLRQMDLLLKWFLPQALVLSRTLSEILFPLLFAYTCQTIICHLKYLAAILDDLSLQTSLFVRLKLCTCSRQEPWRLCLTALRQASGAQPWRLMSVVRRKIRSLYPNWSTVTKQFEQRLDCNNLKALG